MTAADVTRPRSLGSRTMSGMAWTGLGYVTHGAGQLLVLAVLARYIGAEDFGVLSATLLFVGAGRLFTLSVVGPAVVQRSALDRHDLATAFWLSIMSGAIAAVSVAAIAPVAARFFRYDDLTPVLIVLSLSFLLQAPSVVATSLLQRDLAFRSLAIVDIVSFVLGYCLVGVALAVAGAGVWALVAATLAQVLLATVMTIALRRPVMALEFDRRSARKIMHYGTGFTAGKVFNYTASQGDFFVIGRTMSVTSLGYYSRAYQLIAMPAMLFGQVLDRVLFPVMASFQDDRRRLASAYRRGTELVATVMAPLSALAVVLAPEIIDVVLGDGWQPVVAPMQVLAIGLVCRTGYKVSDSLARSAGTVYRRAWRQAIYAVLVVVGTLIGSQWGITGAAWGVLAAIVVNYFSMAQLSIATTKLSWSQFARAHTRGVLLAACATALALLSATALRSVTSRDVVVLAGSVTFVGAFLLPAALLAPRRILGYDAARIVLKATGRRPPARPRLAGVDDLRSLA